MGGDVEQYLSAISTQSKRYIMFLSLSSPMDEDEEVAAALEAFSLIRSVTAINSLASYRKRKRKIKKRKDEN